MSDNVKKTYYALKHFKNLWIHTRPLCKSYDMKILTLVTESEANYVREVTDNSISSLDRFYYIGGMAGTIGSTTDWFWITSGNKISYPIPRGNGETSGFEERCLSIGAYWGDYKFNDGRCTTTESNFMCQKEIIKF